jgi:hypothetical protein
LLRSALQRNSPQYVNTMGSNPPMLWIGNSFHTSILEFCKCNELHRYVLTSCTNYV